ncbi:MAG: hypothetical protein MK082_03865 [Phycisphaerales bacterium]|nr:hypothetical protein [Phycisphaerales bacterium]
MNRCTTLEIPIDSIESARHAVVAADRLEVCSDLDTEGWTPDPELLREVVGLADGHQVEVVALIRPRHRSGSGGAGIEDFLVTTEVMAASLDAVESAADAGANTVAIGPLRSDGRVDREACERLVRHASQRGLRVSFLRSIDLVPDREEAIGTLFELGVVRILTAGVTGWDATAVTLEERAARCRRDVLFAGSLADATEREPIEVMIGGGVRSSNVTAFTACSPHVHSSCREDGRFDLDELERMRRALDRMGSSGG